MVFKYWGKEASQYAIMAGISHQPGKGLRGEDLKSYCEENGFQAFMYQGGLENIKENLRKGRPLIVAVRSRSAKLYHYIVLVGFDDGSSVVLANDPQGGKLKKTGYEKFLSGWKRSRYWSLLIVPK
jgi:uncharacterized protein YvpB